MKWQNFIQHIDNHNDKSCQKTTKFLGGNQI